jgi:hypothetical protein
MEAVENGPVASVGDLQIGSGCDEMTSDAVLQGPTRMLLPSHERTERILLGGTTLCAPPPSQTIVHISSMEILEPDEPDAANAMFCLRIMMAADYAMIMKAIYRRRNVDV